MKSKSLKTKKIVVAANEPEIFPDQPATSSDVPAMPEPISEETTMALATMVSVLDTFKLGDESKKIITEGMTEFMQKAMQLKSRAESIEVTSVDDIELMEEAKELRKTLRECRTGADKKRKELKEESLRYNNAVQGVYNMIEKAVLPLEEHLEKQEKYAEMERLRLFNEMKQKRIELMQGLEDYFPKGIDIGILNEEDFNMMLESASLMKEKAERKAKQEEEERQKKEAEEKAAEEERKKLQSERDEELRREKEKLQREKDEELEKEKAKLREEAEARKKEIDRRIEILFYAGYKYNEVAGKFTRKMERDNFEIVDLTIPFNVVDFDNYLAALEENYQAALENEKFTIEEEMKFDELRTQRELILTAKGFIPSIEKKDCMIYIVHHGLKNIIEVNAFNGGKGYMETDDEAFEEGLKVLDSIISKREKQVADFLKQQEQQAQAEQERQEQEKMEAASDKEKAIFVIDRITILEHELPEMKSKKGRDFISKIKRMLGDIIETAEEWHQNIK